MKITALLLAAAASATLANAAAAQTTTSSTTSTSSTSRSTTPQATAPQVAPPPLPQSGATPAAPASGDAGMASPMTGMTSPAAATGGAFTPISPNPSADIVSTLQASGEFTTFLKAAEATGLTSVLKTPGITVFAPTDAAFAALPPSALDLTNQANLQHLQGVLAYHIVASKVPPLAGHSAVQVTTAAKSPVTLDGSGPAVKINDATALQSQVAASNGVIYPIDKVLTPGAAPPVAATKTETTTQQTTTKTHRRSH